MATEYTGEVIPFKEYTGEVITDEEPSLGSKLKRGVVEMAGVLEAPLAMGTGIVASAYGGWKGLGNLLAGKGINAAAQSVAETQGYQPSTGTGQAITKAVAAPFELASEGWGQIGQEVAGDKGELVGKMIVPAVGAVAGYRPMVAGTQAAVAGAKSAANTLGQASQRGAQSLMISALKPTVKQHMTGDAALAAQELLKRNISPNTKGLIAIEERIAQLNDEIAATIGDSKAAISKQKVLDRLESVRDRFLKTANPEADLAAISAAEQGFAAHPLLPGENIPVQTAQAIKQGTGTELRKKYGELGTAQIEAQKALTRGLKEEISTAVPEVAAMNAEESALIKTLNVAERRAYAELNKDPVPLAGALRSPGAWAALTADKSAAFKALLARKMYQVGQMMKATEAPAAVSPAPTLRRIPINQDIPYSGLPNIGNPPVVPGSWREGMISQEAPRPLPALAEDLLPVADRYAGTDIPIGRVEGGMLTPKAEPLPQLPPQGRGLLSLEEPAAPMFQRAEQPTWQKPLGVDFPLRQEVLQYPAIANATRQFVARAEELKSIINNKYPIDGKKQAAAAKELAALEQEFGAGMRQLGIENAVDALGLRKLYEVKK